MFSTNESILSFIKWCGYFSESVGLEGFIILTESDKPVPARTNDRLRMGAAVMFTQLLLIPVSLSPTLFHTENRMNGGIALFDWHANEPKAGEYQLSDSGCSQWRAEVGSHGGYRVGGGRCNFNQARLVLGELGECVMLQPPYKGTLSHVLAWKLEHIDWNWVLHTYSHRKPAAMHSLNVEDMLRRAETPLFWVGAFTVASLALWLLYRLLSGFRIWVLGNGQLLSPKLGKWAGELVTSISRHLHQVTKRTAYK